jgi:ribose transport system ATP-binding protein
MIERGAALLISSEPPQTVVSVRGLRKVFPGVVALDDVDFDVRPGEVHALLGANGAGKSTLIKIVAGLYRPDGGELRFFGRPVALRDTHHAMNLGISVIYQDLALVPHLSVAENIFLGQERLDRLGLIDWRRTHSEARALLDRIGASFSTTLTLRRLGTGQRQQVEIAKALRRDTRLLVLDEPTAALSQAESERLFNIVRQLARSGVGIIYVSHRLEEIAPLVDRVTVLRDGRSVGTFPAGALDRRKIVALIVGHERASARDQRARHGASGEPVLEVQGLSRPNEFADITFQVRAGEVVVLTGLVGAGRTEILQTLFGARSADAGDISVAGRPVRPTSPRAAIKAGIALIPEDRRGQGIAVILPVFVNITLAVLRLFRAGLGLSVRREIAHARRMIIELGIRAAGLRAAAASLSGGNQQKVVLAKWLSINARVLLFDEPTQGVDVGAKDEIYALIDRLCDQGKAIVVASSDIEEVLAIADRVLAIRAGRIVAEFDKQSLRASAVIDAITHG